MKIIDTIIRQRVKLSLLKTAVVRETNLFTALDKLEEVTVMIDSGCEDIHVSFTGDVMLLRKVWLLLRKSGYRPSVRPTEDDKTNFSTFWYKTDAVTIWMTYSSSVCKHVKVGTRMVEETVYEIQCGDGSPVNSLPTALAELDV